MLENISVWQQILKEEVKMDCRLMFSVSLIFTLFTSFTVFPSDKPRTKLSRKSSSRHSFSTVTVLSCHVESNPSSKVCFIWLVNSIASQVLWYKDGIIISKINTKTKKEGKMENHSLIIPSISESDYGNYSSLAKNNLGTESAYLFLSGTDIFLIIEF